MTMSDAPPSSPPDSAKTARQSEFQYHQRARSATSVIDPSLQLSPSKPIVRDFSTPVLPRSRDGFLAAAAIEYAERMETDSSGFERRAAGGNEGMRNLTGSVVQDRAADGLLSLMMAGAGAGAR